MTWTNSWEISKLEMLRSFKLCVLFVNNRSTISLSYDGSVDLISFVRDTQCGDMNFEGTLLDFRYNSPYSGLANDSISTRTDSLYHIVVEQFLFHYSRWKATHLLQWTIILVDDSNIYSSKVSSNVMFHFYFNSAVLWRNLH